MKILKSLMKKFEIKGIDDTITFEELSVYVKGMRVSIDQVSDETFAEELLGESVAIQPSDNTVYAPISGKVAVLLSTKHGISIITDMGVEILLHIGVDTVTLNGEHFEVLVNIGDYVQKGDPLVTFDRVKIEEKGLDTVVIMIVTNSHDYNITKVGILNQQVGLSDSMMKVLKKEV